MIGSGLWTFLLSEGNLALEEGFTGAHEGFSEDPKVGAISDFLGENFGAVDVARNVFDLDG